MTRRLLAFAACLFFATAAQATPVGVAAELPAVVKEMVRARVDGGKTVGMVIGVVDAQGTTYFGYGRLASGHDDVAAEQVVFEIGSISKVFTGVLLAAAVDRGEARLTDPIETHLPPDQSVPATRGSAIRLVNLSAHNSGLPRMPNNFAPQDPSNPYADYGADDLYAFLGDVSLPREAGEAYEYSNVGVGLLGRKRWRGAIATA